MRAQRRGSRDTVGDEALYAALDGYVLTTSRRRGAAAGLLGRVYAESN